MQDMMLDIETFGTRPGSVIVSIGAVMFDPFSQATGPEFYVNVSAQSCGQLGMLTDKSTLEFWALPENKEAMSRLSNPRPKHLRDALKSFSDFWRKSGAKRVWGHGCAFDVVLVEEAMRRVGYSEKDFPWHFRDLRDTRTLFWLDEEASGMDVVLPRDDDLYPRHEALSDAKWQAVCVQRAVARVAKVAEIE